jgi:hypothetical protein
VPAPFSGFPIWVGSPVLPGINIPGIPTHIQTHDAKMNVKIMPLATDVILFNAPAYFFFD